ncbi:MAG: HNH endonuclease [Bacteroidota bacterium]|nr:HNH endonuclease [Bacteroidota bacterium]MDX5403891.1 HNH endonuclease [Bacteroidota bacterium]MDX5426590.1 HNH endonuclease [Bacteroidota bacterium]MDX5449087.1 HNH endonuclease [Bacteroidota bacterium]MDX5504599.1 HNH endonuclease [Bacteroidota bacterium]
MIKPLDKEEWKQIQFPQGAVTRKYAVSNKGRIASYKYDLLKDGKILKGSIVGGYVALKARPFDKSVTLYVHRLVAERFLKKKSGQKFVIHKDYNKGNNLVENLSWASKEEMEHHQIDNPNIIEGRKKARLKKPMKGHKLTAEDVKKIKKLIFDPNRKTNLKSIAEKFNISEMQLYRIKRGENWSHIEI